MPPFVSRKRAASDEHTTSEPVKKHKVNSTCVSKNQRKPSLFDDHDTESWKNKHSGPRIAKSSHAISGSNDDHEEDEEDEGRSFLMSSSDEFEDISLKEQNEFDGTSDEEDENIVFENVSTTPKPSTYVLPNGDLELTLTKDTRISVTNTLGTKKAPTKIERQIRISTHKCHVQTLMWHNAIRNSWLCDKELHGILLKQLPPAVVHQIEKWKDNSGLSNEMSVEQSLNHNVKSLRRKIRDKKDQRDWVQSTKRVADGQLNTSASDSLFDLLRTLVKYWQGKFRVSTPGLRKIGYMSLQRLDEELKSLSKDEHDPLIHGERFRDLNDFKEGAKKLEGSRDFGAQLFTALLRAIGLNTRMVASLQPVGFGWSKNEEARDRNPHLIKEEGTKNDESDSDSNRQEIRECGDYDDVNNFKRKSEKSVKSNKTLRKPRVSIKKRSVQKSSTGGSSRNQKVHYESESSASSDNESFKDTKLFKKSYLLPSWYDRDLKYPHYWSEVLSPATNTFVPVDAMVNRLVATNRELIEKFEPRSSNAENMKQVIAYVVGHSSNGTAKDLTTRYLKGKMWPGKTKGYRYPPEKIVIRNRNGKVKQQILRDWFKTIMSLYERSSQNYSRNKIDDFEDANDLKPVIREKKEVEIGKESLQYYKTSSKYVLERHLKREEALVLNAKHVNIFTSGKGAKKIQEKVFLRKDVVTCKSAETWHKEGRAPRPGEEPLKRVPYRAATINRKRELAEAEHASGEKLLQGLFSYDQTEWIIPPPIKNGIIPKNSFGNIDLYVESMLPKGAVHIPFRGIPKICKRLDIDYAEAVTGFEFGHRMAVPIITGVVVAENKYDLIMEQWKKDEAERLRKEDEKREKAALHMWRKMVLGLRVLKRFEKEYGGSNDGTDMLNPFTSRKRNHSDGNDSEFKMLEMDKQDEKMAGGFLPEGFDVEEEQLCQGSGFFPVANSDTDDDTDKKTRGLIVEDHDDEFSNKKPASLLSHDDDEKGKKITKDSVLNPKTQRRIKKSTNLLKSCGIYNDVDGREIRKESEAIKTQGQASASSVKAKGRKNNKIIELNQISEPPRKTPQRNAARNATKKTAQVLRSRYFKHTESNENSE